MNTKQLISALVRFYLGTGDAPSIARRCNWNKLIDISLKQGIAGIMFDSIYRLCNLPGNEALKEEVDLQLDDLYHKWAGNLFVLKDMNEAQNSRLRELTALFGAEGFRTCVLKGQGMALLYANRDIRMPGDIDLWVEGSPRRIIHRLKGRWKVEHAVYHHVSVKVFEGQEVEVHYRPAWLYNPLSNRRLQRFFKAESCNQFEVDPQIGFAVPTVKFNLVFAAVHLLKHYYDANVTFKPLVDYYYLLVASTSEDRVETMKVLDSLGLHKFVQILMLDLIENTGLPQSRLLCEVPAERPSMPLNQTLWRLPWRVWHLFWRAVYRYA